MFFKFINNPKIFIYQRRYIYIITALLSWDIITGLNNPTPTVIGQLICLISAIGLFFFRKKSVAASVLSIVWWLPQIIAISKVIQSKGNQTLSEIYYNTAMIFQFEISIVEYTELLYEINILVFVGIFICIAELKRANNGM